MSVTPEQLAQRNKQSDPRPPISESNRRKPTSLRGIKTVLRMLGPGLITGASDDDPSGIVAYSQVGAQFGYSLLWTMVISYPLMAAIQESCARVGRVTGCGISANLRRHYPAWLLYAVVGLVLVANIFNLGADIGAMAAAAQLLLPGRPGLYIVGFGLASLLLQIFVPYTSYAKYLKWLTLSLFAYIATAFFVHIDWHAALYATVVPKVSLSQSWLIGFIAVMGTTISPYLFFWQASQEVEEVRTTRGDKALKHAPRQAPAQFDRIRMDTYIGMALSNIVAFFIILTTAATLHAHGETNISSAAQAAKALAPLAGPWAAGIFTCGIIGTALLAVPVLAGSAAYAIGESRRWPVSLEHKPKNAVRFYIAIAVATIAGIALNFFHIDPMRALYWAAVLNGVLAAPLMAVILHMASSKQVMGKFTIPFYSRVVGWTATAVMFVVSIGAFATWK